MIDSGKPAFKPGQFSSDLDGGDRVVDGNRDGKAVTDLGAYEFQQPTVKIKGIRVKGHHARLRYTAADYTTLRCRIDHVKWEVCPVPHTTYTHLKPGRHRFRIRATNSLYHAKAGATKRFRVRL